MQKPRLDTRGVSRDQLAAAADALQSALVTPGQLGDAAAAIEAALPELIARAATERRATKSAAFKVTVDREWIDVPAIGGRLPLIVGLTITEADA